MGIGVLDAFLDKSVFQSKAEHTQLIYDIESGN